MIRENQKYLNTIQISLDLFFVVFSYIFAHYIRFYVLDDGKLSLSQTELILALIVILPIYFILYNLFDIYSTRRTKHFHKEAIAILEVNIIATTILMVGLFLFKMVNFSRLALIFFFVTNITLTLTARLVIRYVLRKYRRMGYNL